MSIFGWEEFDVTSSFVHFQPWIPWILRQGTPTKTGSTRDHFHPLTPFSPGSRGPLKACVCAWQVKTSRFQQQSEWKKQFDISVLEKKEQVPNTKIQNNKMLYSCTSLFWSDTATRSNTSEKKNTKNLTSSGLSQLTSVLGFRPTILGAWQVRLLGGSIILIHIGVSKNRGFYPPNHPF